jgi:Cdc6-like AAA superfamily ATPase
LAVYDKAISQLADNANFEVIGREEESNRIREFLDNGVRSCGCSYPLHITGVPGIGKTVTVLKILCELKEKYGTVLIPILINVMGFRNEEKIYQSILDRIIS